jgi:hypothetical protein
MLIGLESAGVFRFLFLYLRPFLSKASVLLGLGGDGQCCGEGSNI